MRSQNIKHNSVGAVSCSLLLLLTFLVISPIQVLPAFAEEVEKKDITEQTDYSNQIMTTSAVSSTVEIAFSPSSASSSITPADSTTGDKAKIDIRATVRVQNSGGYKVYVGSSSSQLKNGNNVIDSVISASSYANLPLNRWGYSFRRANNASDRDVADSYVAMPATLRSSALDSNTNANIASDTRYYMLSFAAHIGGDKPAGTYTNAVTVSVISSPLEIANKFGIDSMQEMTSGICSSAESGTTDQLEDVRDGKFYWVSKLADGKCWMTQNLDLDLSTDTELSMDDSDVLATGYTPVYDTAVTADDSTILDEVTGQRSWSLGDYRIINPDVSSDCGHPEETAANCVSQFTAYATPTSANGDTNAHYILGNHYQWNTATAGTGGTIRDGAVPSGSVCAKGWRLPDSGEFGSLVAALGGAKTTNNITKAPFYGVRGGLVEQNDSSLFASAGDDGAYWSSTPLSDNEEDENGEYWAPVTSASALFFGGSNIVSLYSEFERQAGLSIRCVAK